jgi:hypothetical protein
MKAKPMSIKDLPQTVTLTITINEAQLLVQMMNKMPYDLVASTVAKLVTAIEVKMKRQGK